MITVAKKEVQTMHMTLNFATGRRVDGLLLAASPDRMRLAVRDRNETIELNVEAGQWRAEDGSMVEIEALIWNGVTAIPAWCGEAEPKLFTAGG
jgi:hypothetical protein